jgi:hypothetical protein
MLANTLCGCQNGAGRDHLPGGLPSHAYAASWPEFAIAIDLSHSCPCPQPPLTNPILTPVAGPLQANFEGRTLFLSLLVSCSPLFPLYGTVLR